MFPTVDAIQSSHAKETNNKNRIFIWLRQKESANQMYESENQCTMDWIQQRNITINVGLITSQYQVETKVRTKSLDKDARNYNMMQN